MRDIKFEMNNKQIKGSGSISDIHRSLPKNIKNPEIVLQQKDNRGQLNVIVRHHSKIKGNMFNIVSHDGVSWKSKSVSYSSFEIAKDVLNSNWEKNEL